MTGRRVLAMVAPILLAAMAALAQPAAAAESDKPELTKPEPIPRPGAVLQGLDKITARVSELSLRNGEVAQFGGLVIRVSACSEAPPEAAPEATAFIEIGDGRTKPAVLLFRGWMFASSPAVSALEHPVYDIRVLRCLQPEGED